MRTPPPHWRPSAPAPALFHAPRILQPSPLLMLFRRASTSYVVAGCVSSTRCLRLRNRTLVVFPPQILAKRSACRFGLYAPTNTMRVERQQASPCLVVNGRQTNCGVQLRKNPSFLCDLTSESKECKSAIWSTYRCVTPDLEFQSCD